MHQGGGNHFAVALALLNGNHAFGATAVACVFVNQGAFAKAVFGGSEHAVARGGLVGFLACLPAARYQHGNYVLPFFERHAAHAAGVASHGAHVVFIKAHGFAAIAKEHHIVRAVGKRCANQVVAIVQANGNDACFAWVAKFRQRRFLDCAFGSSHKGVAVFREAACFAGQGQHHGDFFVFLQGEHIDDGPSARATAACGHFPHLEPVQPPTVAEAQNVFVRVGDKELVNPVVFFGGSSQFAAPAAFLCAVFRQGLAFDVTRMAQGNDHIGRRNQVFRAQLLRVVLNLAAARACFGLAKFGFDGNKLIRNKGRNTLGLGQNIQQVVNFSHHFFVFGNDFVLLQACKALQAHLQNLLRLHVAQAVQAVLRQTKLTLE